MQSKSRELIFALIAAVFITLAYLFMQIAYGRIPPAASFYGHSMGVLGFILMLMTETLYSLRKRSRNARWGKMADWLEFHIFTGLIGPYLVLLHSSWRFNGLAGVLMLFTILIVASGFVGRYIYTSIPRSTSGEELSMEELEVLVAQTESDLARLEHPRTVAQGEWATVGAAQIKTRGPTVKQWWGEVQEAVASWQGGKRLSAEQLERQKVLSHLRAQRDRLKRQMSSLAAARRLLSIWHTIHIPLGLTLFLMAFIHVGAAIYYATLLR
jgi:hypothetical protein